MIKPSDFRMSRFGREYMSNRDWLEHYASVVEGQIDQTKSTQPFFPKYKFAFFSDHLKTLCFFCVAQRFLEKGRFFPHQTTNMLRRYIVEELHICRNGGASGDVFYYVFDGSLHVTDDFEKYKQIVMLISNSHDHMRSPFTCDTMHRANAEMMRGIA